MDVKKTLEAVFERLQRLDIKPTLSNMEILLQALYDLRSVYNALPADEEKKGE